ncbi:VanZ family protein [Alsobacter sp. SYSU BS001988]
MELSQVWNALVRMGRRRAPWVQVALVATLSVLSLLPGEERPHTGLPGQIEHVVAYCGTGLIVGVLAHSQARRLGWAAGLIALAGALEFLQAFVPGRTSQAIDWIASSSGAIIGVGVALLLARWSPPAEPGLGQAAPGE